MRFPLDSVVPVTFRRRLTLPPSLLPHTVICIALLFTRCNSLLWLQTILLCTSHVSPFHFHDFHAFDMIQHYGISFSLLHACPHICYPPIPAPISLLPLHWPPRALILSNASEIIVSVAILGMLRTTWARKWAYHFVSYLDKLSDLIEQPALHRQPDRIV